MKIAALIFFSLVTLVNAAHACVTVKPDGTYTIDRQGCVRTQYNDPTPINLPDPISPVPFSPIF